MFRAGGRSFPDYFEHDEQLCESYAAYPDFEEYPEYTGEERPFATVGQESCFHASHAQRETSARRLRRLRMVLPGTNALRLHRSVHVRRAAARKWNRKGEKRMKAKRLLSVLLCAVFISALLPTVNVHAEEYTYTYEYNGLTIASNTLAPEYSVSIEERFILDRSPAATTI